MPTVIPTIDIPNLFAVEQDIFRGAQPTKAGWDWLKDQGVKDVVKLNTQTEGSDAYAATLGMMIHRFPIPWWRQVLWPPSQNLLFNAVACIRANTFIHCGSDNRTASADAQKDNTQGGEDRTGLIIACFRLSQGWTVKDAYEEMLAHGFHRLMLALQRAWDKQTPMIWQNR